jgi:hypothetical protein
MATWDDVRRITASLPETTERAGGHNGGAPQWRVRDKPYAWERPLRPRDLDELGAAAPDGPILAARVADEGVKQALLAEGGACFTIPHFDGYPAVLVRLERIEPDDLRELLTEAWAVQAPKRLSKQFLGE